MEKQKPTPYVRKAPFPQRNQLCTCGSGKKFKKCCEPKYFAKLQQHVRTERAKQLNK